MVVSKEDSLRIKRRVQKDTLTSAVRHTHPPPLQAVPPSQGPSTLRFFALQNVPNAVPSRTKPLETVPAPPKLSCVCVLEDRQRASWLTLLRKLWKAGGSPAAALLWRGPGSSAM